MMKRGLSLSLRPWRKSDFHMWRAMLGEPWNDDSFVMPEKMTDHASILDCVSRSQGKTHLTIEEKINLWEKEIVTLEKEVQDWAEQADGCDSE
ncbi:unnamed protein product [Arabis nemorensis]|uniref:Uncharacterized protein n=1 Tax=Arabis nemorensis TaxID=586526 RepID=A0A565CHJ7_9BRAS|nr:unnamed protein product [Arabis nemorensis]